MTPPVYIFDEIARRERGLSLHYAFLYGAVIGLEARSVVEFGAGMSTRVILDALDELGGDRGLLSCSTDPREVVGTAHGFDPAHPRWLHFCGLSRAMHERWTPPPADLILHDGAHDGQTVEADLREALPSLRRYGLALIHDTQHEVHGAAMRRAVEAACYASGPYSMTTLPYGFGLTILRCEDPARSPIALSWRKVGSPFTTVPA